jgi:TonB family protein
MESFDTEELSDQELSQMLATWTVHVPTERLRTRIFAMVPAVPPQPTFAVGNIWSGFAERRKRNLAFGLLIQAAAVASLFLAVQPTGHVLKAIDQSIIVLSYYHPKVPALRKAGGGGGGGQRDKSAAAKGAAPLFARKQFMPPAVAIVQPKLAVVPTITAPAPSLVAENYDDPLSNLTGNSGGQGINGFGDGKGGGIGKGNGDGLGDGEGGGSGGGIYRVGGEVSSPQLISKVEPEYSEEARKAKYSGVVHLSVVIDEHGIPTDIRVTGPLGLGLDEKAVEAVQHWRFRPGIRNGKPVKVRAAVEVSFRLL